METKKITTVDEYIASFPEDVQALLHNLRATIKKAAPEAEESISYHLAAYSLHGPLVYFGGFKAHVSLFPTASNLAPFDEELAPYKRSKGTIQFAMDKPLPLKLIGQIVKYRVKQNKEKTAMKMKK